MPNYRVALVAIHVCPGDEAVPLGAGSVAAALRASSDGSAGFEPVLLEFFASDSPEKVAKALADVRPDFVGFSLYVWNRALSLDAAVRARSLLPDAVFFAGGPEATASTEGLVGTADAPFDFVVAGEGEESLPAALRAVTEGGDPSAVPGVSDAEKNGGKALPAPLSRRYSPWLDGTLDPAKRPGALWELARGCPYACAYCFESKGERRLRRIDQDRFEAELDLFARSGLKSVFVLDPTFNADKEKAKRALGLILEKAPGIHWHFEVRAESLDKEQARLFAALGASLQIGLQTSRPDVAALVDRSFDPGVFSSRVELLNRAGAVFGLDLIYGLPGDDYDGFRSSVDFALGLYPNHLDVFRLAVLPGTALFDRAGSHGLRSDDTAPYLVRSTPTFPASDLDKAERLAAAIEVFYSKGRAVPWFNQVLHAIGGKASAFLEGFARFLGKTAEGRLPYDPADPVGIERLQLGYLDSVLEGGKKEYLLPAIWDVVRFHGAWSRAVAEGIESTMECNYDPESLVAGDPVDLEEFASIADPTPCRLRVSPGENDPKLTIF